jgi:ABC-2 type transport system ATP-binding protein
MDEAERCHRIACLAFGNLLVSGTVSEVVANAKLSTWSVGGPALGKMAETLRGQPGVEQVVPFGSILHVSGHDARLLGETIERVCGTTHPHNPITSGLEDVFIGLMDTAKDSYS